MMKALTVYQPWASLIMVGAKPHEFRGWDFSTKPALAKLIGHRVVIHASAREIKPGEIMDLLRRLDDGTTGLIAELARPLLERIYAAHRCRGVVELGAGLGTAILGKTISVTEMAKGTVLQDSDRVDHSLFGWPVTEPERFDEPQFRPGAQGFFNWLKAPTCK